MTHQPIGTCSLCGGEVRAFVGPWAGIQPPPPPSCVKCDARPRSAAGVIDMVPAPRDVSRQRAAEALHGTPWGEQAARRVAAPKPRTRQDWMGYMRDVPDVLRDRAHHPNNDCDCDGPGCS